MCQYILYLYYYISIMAPKTENEPALEEQNVTEHQPRQVYTADYLTWAQTDTHTHIHPGRPVA